MAAYLLHDPSSNTWRGPFDEAAIRQDVANGHIEPNRWIWSGQPSDAPISASSIPVPAPAKQDDGVPDWLKLVLIAGGAVVAGVVLGEVIDALADKPRSAPLPLPLPSQPSSSFALLQSLLPPPDPERVAIQQSAEWHAQRGAEVRADIPGWPRPPVLDGRIPDVHADYGDRVVIEEYENEQSISRTHASEQDATFTRWANRSYRREYTQLVVPGGRGGRG